MSDRTWEFSPKRLRGHRERNGLSRVELGQMVACKGDSIKRMELGWLKPSLHTFLSLAGSLGISPNDLCRKSSDDLWEFSDARYRMPPNDQGSTT